MHRIFSTLQKTQFFKDLVLVNVFFFWGGRGQDFESSTGELTKRVLMLKNFHTGAMGAEGVKAPLKISKKGKNRKYGVFSCIKD